MCVAPLHKDITNERSLTRGDSLRVLTSLNLPDLYQIFYMTIQKLINDHNVYVRKVA